MEFNERKELFIKYFDLGYFSGGLDSKLKLIGLICFLYNRLHPKRPGLTYYELISSINKPETIDDEMIQRLAIICESFAYGTKEFSSFGVETKDMVPTIKTLLLELLPF